MLRDGGLDDPRVVALLATHVARCRAETARGSAHALDLAALKAPDIRFWSAWDGEELLGCGALRRLDPAHGEVKSMHTAQAARRRGVGRAILATIIGSARADGLRRLSLETGSWPFFDGARAFYQAQGFAICPPFGDYLEDPHSVFMTMNL